MRAARAARGLACGTLRSYWWGYGRVPYRRGMTTTAIGLDHLHELVGKHLGYSEWHVIDQERIDLFAEATGDHQWIHVDPERAKDGPFGATIAHGYFSLSLVPVLLGDILVIEGMALGVNYGCNKVRFPSPVPVGTNAPPGVPRWPRSMTKVGCRSSSTWPSRPRGRKSRSWSPRWSTATSAEPPGRRRVPVERAARQPERSTPCEQSLLEWVAWRCGSSSCRSRGRRLRRHRALLPGKSPAPCRPAGRAGGLVRPPPP